MAEASEFVERLCPHCGAGARARPEIASGTPAETIAFDSLKPFWNGFFKEKVFFTYLRCPTCGLLFNRQFFSPSQLDELYAQMPPNMDLVPVSALRKTQRGYFEFLKSRSPLQGGYLEFGPDVGYFLENCVSEGGFERYWLVEPNRAVAPALEAAVGQAPHAIAHDMTGLDQVPAGSVGAAVMVHVLDHLLDPLQTLRDIRSKLAPGGAILVVTHDESSALRRAFSRRWPPFCLQHPQLFRPSTLTTVLQSAGFTDVSVRRSVNYFPVAFLLKQFLWAIGIRAASVPDLGGVVIGLRLGNIMAVAAA